MSKEHNIDQIPDHQAYIFLPTKSFFHYSYMTPTRILIHKDEAEEMGIDEEQVRDINRMVRTFWIKGDADFDELRHLRFCCWNASIDNTSVPKLRSEGLESELKRIFGAVRTANEIDEACLEVDCLLATMKGETDKAVWAMHHAAQKDSDDRGIKELTSLKNHSTLGDGSKNSWRRKILTTKTETTKDMTNTTQEKSTDQEGTSKKLAVTAIIDGKFSTSDKNPILRRENRRLNTNSNGSTSKTSPNKYLHPHTFDSDTTYYDLTHDDTFNSHDTTMVEAIGSQRENWRAEE
jgi:hypothetical protein